ncbi:TonB family protein [bacterium]|nr:TonB family protein [bacterium]
MRRLHILFFFLPLVGWWQLPTNAQSSLPITQGPIPNFVLTPSTLPRCQGDEVKNWDRCFGTTSAYGNNYAGEFREGKYDGQGTVVLPDGGRYIGEFKGGWMTGRGTRTFANGTSHSGDWREDKREGKGTEYGPDGHETRSGVWRREVFFVPDLATVDRGSCSNPEALYPPESRRMNETGITILRFGVEPSGILSFVDIEKSSGFRRLDEAARKFLETCKFSLGTVNGKPERSSGTFNVEWRLAAEKEQARLNPEAELKKGGQLSDSQYVKAVEGAGGIANFLNQMLSESRSFIGRSVDARTTILSVDVDVSSLTFKTVFRVTGTSTLTKPQRDQFQKAQADSSIQKLCSTRPNAVLISVYGVSYITEHVDDDLRVLSSFVANRESCSSYLLNVSATSTYVGSESFNEKFATKGHAKAKGISLTVRYPNGWKASEGDRPNIVQKFIGPSSNLPLLQLQIRDSGAGKNFEQFCRDTSGLQWNEFFSDAQAGMKVTNSEKVLIEGQPGVMSDMAFRMQRLDVVINGAAKQLFVCFKDKAITLSCTVGEVGETAELAAKRLKDSAGLCRNFFNSLVIMEKY